MRPFAILSCVILLTTCGSDRPAPSAPPAEVDSDTLWSLIAAQDHRDIPALLAFLDHPLSEVRERAALAFASNPDSSAVNALVGRLADPEPAVLKAVAVAIGNAGDSTAWVALSQAAEVEKDTSVSRVMHNQAFKAEIDLKQVKDPSRLFDQLTSDDRSIRLRAAQQLGRMPKEKMEGAEASMLKAARDERDPDVRMFLVAAMKHYRSDAVGKTLMTWGAGDSLASVRVSALRALGAREDNALAAFFIDCMNDGSQAVRLTAIEQLQRLKGPIDAQPIWEAAQTHGDPFTQIPLYGLVLKHGDQGQRLIARKLLEAQAALENMPYAEAAILQAQANDSAALVLAEMRKAMNSAPTLVERTTAFEGAMHVAQALEMGASSRPALYGGILGDALSSGDAGLIASACEQIVEWDPVDLQAVLTPALEEQARQALRPIRDLEARQDLDAVVAKRDGKPAPTHQGPPFNHPIDRERLRTIKDGQQYVIKTTKGDITIALEPMAAPGSCVAFDSLATAGYYAAKYFHRVVPNFVAQGGCPRGDGWGGMDWTLRTEIAYDGFTKGAVGLASAGRDTESCQFFIMTAPAPHLDGKYTRFAHVVEGMDVAEQLAVGDRILLLERVK